MSNVTGCGHRIATGEGRVFCRAITVDQLTPVQALQGGFDVHSRQHIPSCQKLPDVFKCFEMALRHLVKQGRSEPQRCDPVLLNRFS